jgi:hypothetical protein
VPPESGTSPIFAKAWMNLAERAARTISQASAMLAPAPAAVPFTAQTTGIGSARSLRTSGCRSARSSNGGRASGRVRQAVRQVLAGAEAAARSGQQQRPAGRIGLGRLQRRHEVPVLVLVEGVQPVRRFRVRTR